MDSANAERITGVGMYGTLMMARRGEMNMKDVAGLFARLTGLPQGACQPGCMPFYHRSNPSTSLFKNGKRPVRRCSGFFLLRGGRKKDPAC